MLSNTLVSNESAPGPWLNTGRMRVGLFLLIVTCTAWESSLAQEPSEDPEDRFSSLLLEFSLDSTRDIVAEEFGEAVAVDIAVYLCSPDPDDDCEGSTVFDAWSAFLEGIDQGDPVAQVTQGMQDFDEYLVSGIAVYWCSPEPGDGCGTDRFTQAWSEFETLTASDPNPADAVAQISASTDPLVAQLIAASVCGEPTCYAEELGELDVDQLAQIDQPRPEPQTRQQSGPDLQFANKPGRPPKKLRAWLCARGWVKKRC